jgi:hypothetical protein
MNWNPQKWVLEHDFSGGNLATIWAAERSHTYIYIFTHIYTHLVGGFNHLEKY